jgi:transglutaminase-like putative cysteine protease
MSSFAVPSWRISAVARGAVDPLAAVVLTALALVGFQAAFDSSTAIIVGIAGAVLGGAVTLGILRLNLPLFVGVLAAAVVFVAAAAIAVHVDAVASVLPGPKAISALFDGLINGWRRLLTSSPPMSAGSYTLVVPYSCGFAAAGSSVAMAVRWRGSPACVLPPIAVLVVATLMGTSEPTSIVLQGGLFVLVLVIWLSSRESIRRQVVAQRTRRGQRAGAVALLVIAAGGALLVGDHLPFATGTRYVLREHVLPPFDPSVLPSPLAGYRKYLKTDVANDVVLTAEGLPAGARVRLAVLDEYDGTVWGAARPGSAGAGRYERSQAATEGPAAGAKVTLEIGSLTGYNVPTVIGASDVQITKANGQPSDGLRTNAATSSALDLTGIKRGDKVTFFAESTAAPGAKELANAQIDLALVKPLSFQLPAATVAKIQSIVAKVHTPYLKADALAKWARAGYYSDGTEKSPAPPGHSAGRLVTLFEGQNSEVGNGEQYAAAAALAARQLGLPARVVMGFVPDGSGDVSVRAKQVGAWVEVAFKGAGWVPFNVTPPTSRTPKNKTDQIPKDSSLKQPPPSVTQQTEQTAQSRPKKTAAKKDRASSASGGSAVLVTVVGYSALPILVIVLPILLIIGLKARRRRHRRSRGAPEARITGAWQEVIDQARDLGYPVPSKATRKEVARDLDIEGLPLLAAAVDEAHFGSGTPTDDSVDSVWISASSTVNLMRLSRRRRRRMRAKVSISSLRSTR